MNERTSVATRTDAPWLFAAMAVSRAQVAAEHTGNRLVVLAAKALWQADLRREHNPAAWAIVAEFVRAVEHQT